MNMLDRDFPLDGEPIVITDIKIPFWSLVVILVKLAFAAIPAAMIVALISWLTWFAALAILAAMSR